MRISKKKALGIALLVQLLLYCVQSLVLTAFSGVGQQGRLALSCFTAVAVFGIPLMLSHTVVQIHGKERVTGVTIAKVDEQRRPIKETEQYIACDTLLLSCGLLPENELTAAAGIALDGVTGGAVVNENRETEMEG